MSKSVKDRIAERHPPLRDLSWPRRVRRVTGWAFFVSSLAMAVAAATASSDWDVTSQSNGVER